MSIIIHTHTLHWDINVIAWGSTKALAVYVYSMPQIE